MRIILVLCCCIVLGACKETWYCCDSGNPRFHFTFMDSEGNAVLQDSTQKVIIRDEHQVALRVTRFAYENNQEVVAFGVAEREMNQEFSLEIPSLNYKRDFLIQNGSHAFETSILLDGREFLTEEGHFLGRFFILELPL